MKKAQIALLGITSAFIFLTLGIFIGRNTSGEFHLFPGNDSTIVSNTPSETDPAQRGKINVNTATAQELTMLPGIGPVLAQRIIDYRTENGPFTQIQDLLQVSGIGEKRLEDIEDYIVLGEAYENSSCG